MASGLKALIFNTLAVLVSNLQPPTCDTYLQQSNRPRISADVITSPKGDPLSQGHAVDDALALLDKLV